MLGRTAHLERIVEEQANDGRDEHHGASEKRRQSSQVAYPRRVYRETDLFKGCRRKVCEVSGPPARGQGGQDTHLLVERSLRG